MKKLILVRGVPGAGKTTFARFLAEFLNVDDVSAFAADDFHYDENGNYNFDITLMHKAHLSCQQNVQIAMSRGHAAHMDFVNGDRQYDIRSVIIVHNTSTTEKELKPYMELADEYDYEVTSLVVENRHGNQNVHNVPQETLERMRNRFSVKL